MKKNTKPFNGYGSIYDTKLEIELINSSDLYNSLPHIERGSEGATFKYNGATAIKIPCYMKKRLLSQKFAKIDLLGTFQDDSFEFPQKLIGFENLKKCGYSMNFIERNAKCGTLAELVYFKDNLRKIQTLIKGDDAIRRIHKRGIFIGDIRGANILINSDWEPKFIDTDNYAVGNFGFDIIPERTYIYKRIYKKGCSLMDNDKFLYAALALQSFTYGTFLLAGNSDYFKSLIKFLDINNYSKEILTAIFSDSYDKPYIGEMLKEIDSERNLIKREDAYYLNAQYIYSKKH